MQSKINGRGGGVDLKFFADLIIPVAPLVIMRMIRIITIQQDIVEVIAAREEAAMEYRRINDRNALLIQLVYKGDQVLRMMVYGKTVGDHYPVQLHIFSNFFNGLPVLCADADPGHFPLCF